MQVKLLPVSVKVTHVDEGADLSVGCLSGEDLSLLSVRDTAFLRANYINDGWIDQSEIAVVPEFTSALFSVALGMNSASEQEWFDYYRMFARCVRHLDFFSLTGQEGIMCSDLIDIDSKNRLQTKRSNQDFAAVSTKNVDDGTNFPIIYNNSEMSSTTYSNDNSEGTKLNGTKRQQSSESGVSKTLVLKSKVKTSSAGDYSVSTLDCPRSKRSQTPTSPTRTDDKMSIISSVLTDTDVNKENVVQIPASVSSRSQTVSLDTDSVQLIDEIFNVIPAESVIYSQYGRASSCNTESASNYNPYENHTVSREAASELDAAGNCSTNSKLVSDVVVDDEGYQTKHSSVSSNDRGALAQLHSTEIDISGSESVYREGESVRSSNILEVNHASLFHPRTKSVHQLTKVFQSQDSDNGKNQATHASAQVDKTNRASQSSSSSSNQKQSSHAGAGPTNSNSVPSVLRMSSVPLDSAASDEKSRTRNASISSNQSSSVSIKPPIVNKKTSAASHIKPANIQPAQRQRQSSTDSVGRNSPTVSGTSGVNTATSQVGIVSMDDVPKDLMRLNVNEVGQCLKLLSIDAVHIEEFRRANVNGRQLTDFTEAELQKKFKFTAFNASKLMRFVRGWRP